MNGYTVKAGRAVGRGRAGISLRGRWWRWAEWCCWTAAALLLAPPILAMSARALLTSSVTADWSDSRLAAFERLSQTALPVPVGHLALEHQSFRIPVFHGTSETSLTLGAGLLPDTGVLNGPGNTAIAGHRDGFFRALRDVEIGDVLELEGATGERAYRITETWIVHPRDVWVLEDTPRRTLTLITCHPFYFVGHAPNRFVVRAVAEEELAAGSPATRQPKERSL